MTARVGWIDVSRISTGWTVWEKLPPEVEADEHGRARRGGTVVRYIDEGRGGEETVRVFTVLDFVGGRPRLTELRADELEPAMAAEPNNYFLKTQALRLANNVGRKLPKNVGATELFQLEVAVRFLEIATR